MINAIVIEFLPGTSISEAYTLANVIAMRIGAGVFFDFNGVRTAVAPHDNPAQLVERWFLDDLARKERAKQQAAAPKTPSADLVPTGRLEVRPCESQPS